MDRREMLLDAAEATFAELGYDQASMKVVAQRAGVATGLAYRYFPSKEAVLAAVLQRGLADIQRTLAQLASSPAHTPQDRLRHYLHVVVQTVQSYRNRWSLLHQVRLHPALRHLLATPEIEAFRTQIVHQLLASLPTGTHPASAQALFATVDGLVLHLLEAPIPPDHLPDLLTQIATRFSA